MEAYMVTHSLLSSWLYLFEENPYETADSEDTRMDEFVKTLRRVPSEPNEYMMNGINFENIVDTLVETSSTPSEIDFSSVAILPMADKWYEAGKAVATSLIGAQLQYRASAVADINGMNIFMYGRLDALKGGTIYDIKFSKGYERGRYIDYTQHPMYMELVPEAQKFTYIVSDGNSVWTETYRRDETKDIKPIISDFIDWLNATGMMEIYKENWLAK